MLEDMAGDELLQTEEISCPWFVAGDSVPTVVYSKPPVVSGGAIFEESEEEGLVVFVDPETVKLVNMLSFTISGLDEVTSSTFEDAYDAVLTGLSMEFINIAVTLWNVSMQVTPATCDIKVGAILPLSVARFSEMRLGLTGKSALAMAQTAIKMELFDAGFRNAKVTVDNEAKSVLNVPQRETCNTQLASATSQVTMEEFSNQSDSTARMIPPNALLMILIFLYSNL